MQLEENGRKVQSLDLSRHASYVLGRSSANAKIVVPHESVSRQHAAIVHARRGAEGAPSVHVIDLGSAKGTFIDLGSGWTRVPPKTPTLWPPGGRLRLGDCPTRVVFPRPLAAPPASELVTNVGATAMAPPVAGPMLPAATSKVDAVATTSGASAAAPTASADATIEDDSTPRFSSLLSSTLLRPAGPELPTGPEPLKGTNATAKETAASADESAEVGEVPVDEEGENGTASASIGPSGPEAPLPLKNADFRNALLPFLGAPKPVDELSSMRNGSEKAKGKRSKKRKANDDSESDCDAPPPPMVLDKSDPAGGLVLRKEKAVVSKKKSSAKIKF